MARTLGDERNDVRVATLFGAESNNLYNFGNDGTGSVWSLKRNRVAEVFGLSTVGSAQARTYALASTAAGPQLAATTAYSDLTVHDFRTKTNVLHQPLQRDDTPEAIAILPSGTGAALWYCRGNGPGALCIVEAKASREIPVEVPDGRIESHRLAISPDGSRCAIDIRYEERDARGVRRSKCAILLIALSGEPTVSRIEDVAYIYHLTWHPVQRFLLVADGTSILAFNEAGERLALIKNVGTSLGGLFVSRDGLLCGAFSNDNSVEIWNFYTGELCLRHKHLGQRLYHGSFSPDNRFTAIGTCDGRILLLKNHENLAEKLAPASDREQLWEQLASTEAGVAQSAFAQFSRDASSANVAYLAEKVGKSSNRSFASILKDLDAADFAVRQQSQEVVQQYGVFGLQQSRQFAKQSDSLEVRERLHAYKEGVSKRSRLSGDVLRRFWAVRILEKLDTTQARALLNQVAQDESDEFLSIEAQAALARSP